jgi:hypothetical protein
MHVTEEGLRWVSGASDVAGQTAELALALGLPEVHAAQAGLVADMDLVADHVYGRAL